MGFAEDQDFSFGGSGGKELGCDEIRKREEADESNEDAKVSSDLVSLCG